MVGNGANWGIPDSDVHKSLPPSKTLSRHTEFLLRSQSDVCPLTLHESHSTSTKSIWQWSGKVGKDEWQADEPITMKTPSDVPPTVQKPFPLIGRGHVTALTRLAPLRATKGFWIGLGALLPEPGWGSNGESSTSHTHISHTHTTLRGSRLHPIVALQILQPKTFMLVEPRVFSCHTPYKEADYTLPLLIFIRKITGIKHFNHKSSCR